MHHHTPHVPSATHVRVGLAIHPAIFCIVNALLAVINLASGGELWFQWPLLGWGIGGTVLRKWPDVSVSDAAAPI